ncbi:Gfo/Idh/MocA family protein [Streptomyces sp. NP160]|uniref:Gfo/Idh/MocA family protein n=1 Tax=Streptomyces sp. NP160 TaxID=2586637 RepID=UPI0035A69D3E
MTSAAPRPLGVAVVGFGWMGRVHAQSYARVTHHFPDLGVRPELVVVADEVPGRAEAAAAQYGFASAVQDWHEVLTEPRVEAVSVTAPNFFHREIGAAVAAAGKHLWIEKPVGVGAADATAVRDAVGSAGVRAAVGFNYRWAPAVQEARARIAAGAIGEVEGVRIRLLSDYAADPAGALSWRYSRERGGAGVLGDLASHGVDLARYLVGEINAVVADTAVFIPRRAVPSAATSGHQRVVLGESTAMGDVENEDAVTALLRFASGARGVLEASRVAVGEQNTYGFEVAGNHGVLRWDFRRMGELSVSGGRAGDGSVLYQDAPTQTLFVGPGHGDHAAFQPGAAIAMGYDDLKVVEAARFLRAVADPALPAERGPATLDDAVASARALDAMSRSVTSGAWEPLA